MDKPEQPTLSQLMEAQILAQESWLLLAESCHKSDRQETIECVAATAGELLSKMGRSAAFVEATQTMLSRLMDVCYDTSTQATLKNMRDAFTQVNTLFSAAFTGRQTQQS